MYTLKCVLVILVAVVGIVGAPRPPQPRGRSSAGRRGDVPAAGFEGSRTVKKTVYEQYSAGGLGAHRSVSGSSESSAGEYSADEFDGAANRGRSGSGSSESGFLSQHCFDVTLNVNSIRDTMSALIMRAIKIAKFADGMGSDYDDAFAVDAVHEAMSAINEIMENFRESLEQAEKSFSSGPEDMDAASVVYSQVVSAIAEARAQLAALEVGKLDASLNDLIAGFGDVDWEVLAQNFRVERTRYKEEMRKTKTEIEKRNSARLCLEKKVEEQDSNIEDLKEKLKRLQAGRDENLGNIDKLREDAQQFSTNLEETKERANELVTKAGIHVDLKSLHKFAAVTQDKLALEDCNFTLISRRMTELLTLHKQSWFSFCREYMIGVHCEKYEDIEQLNVDDATARGVAEMNSLISTKEMKMEGLVGGIIDEAKRLIEHECSHSTLVNMLVPLTVITKGTDLVSNSFLSVMKRVCRDLYPHLLDSAKYVDFCRKFEEELGRAGALRASLLSLPLRRKSQNLEAYNAKKTQARRKKRKGRGKARNKAKARGKH